MKHLNGLARQTLCDAMNKQFQTYQESLGKAIHVWVCHSCGTWHEVNKPSLCMYCKNHIFEYCASKAEAKRYAELNAMKKQGLIERFQTQVKFNLKVNGISITTYRCDFLYYKNGEMIVEDVKGYTNNKNAITRLFLLQKKLMLACHGIDVKVIQYEKPTYRNFNHAKYSYESRPHGLT